MKPGRKILVVEDDEAIRIAVCDALALEAFAVASAADGPEGMDLALTIDCDLVLLDLVLPGTGGLEILAQVRSSRPTLPVIILTARGEEADRIRGLQLGADDYIVKPFSVAELVARVRAVLRRSAERPLPVATIELGGCVVDLARRRVQRDDGEPAELTQREADLLAYLAASGGRVVSRGEILHRVWRLDPSNLDTRTVDMTVMRLRDKLGEPAAGLLRTVRGVGYELSGRPGGEQ